MKKAFSTRKVPRRVGADEDVPSKSNADGSVSSGISNRPTKFRATCSLTRVHSPRRSLTDHVIESTLRRPSSKPRKSSSLRTSFGPSTVEDQEADESGGVITPKRSNLSRITIQRNASKRTSLLASSLPARDPHATMIGRAIAHLLCRNSRTAHPPPLVTSALPRSAIRTLTMQRRGRKHSIFPPNLAPPSHVISSNHPPQPSLLGQR